MHDEYVYAVQFPACRRSGVHVEHVRREWRLRDRLRGL
jgi:hypothetical protein